MALSEYETAMRSHLKHGSSCQAQRAEHSPHVVCLDACSVFFIRFQASSTHAEGTRHIWLVHVFAVVDLWGSIAYAVIRVNGFAQPSINDPRTAVMHGACLRCVSAPATQLYIHSLCAWGPSSFAVGTHPYTGASTQPLMGARLRGGGPSSSLPW